MTNTTKVNRVNGERGWTIVQFGGLVMVTLERNSTQIAYRKSVNSDWRDYANHSYLTPVGHVLVQAAELAESRLARRR